MCTGSPSEPCRKTSLDLDFVDVLFWIVKLQIMHFIIYIYAFHNSQLVDYFHNAKEKFMLVFVL